MEKRKIKDYTGERKAVMIYFFNPGCVACNSLRPRVEEMAGRKFPAMDFVPIDASLNPLLTAEAGVYSSPSILVFFDGKEYIRESKYISVDQLEEKISRYYDMVFN